MVADFVKIYSLYADQISRILRNKNEMWGIGFRNGLLSPCTKDVYTSNHLAMDYDIGFKEGRSYALYKLAMLHNKENLKSDSTTAAVSEPGNVKHQDIIVGYIVQDYDFSPDSLSKTALGIRNLDIAASFYSKPYNQTQPVLSYHLRLEKEKIGSMLNYLKQHN